MLHSKTLFLKRLWVFHIHISLARYLASEAGTAGHFILPYRYSLLSSFGKEVVFIWYKYCFGLHRNNHTIPPILLGRKETDFWKKYCSHLLPSTRRQHVHPQRRSISVKGQGAVSQKAIILVLRYEVLTTVNRKITIFWHIMS